MSTISYSFGTSVSSTQGTSPLTLVFYPSGINVGVGGYLNKITYEFPDKIITRRYTFVSDSEALTDPYVDYDSRVPVTYTIPGSSISDTGTTFVITVTAVAGPSFTTSIFTLSATVFLQYLTKSPTGSSASYAFEEVHLLKTRAWGANNSQLFVFETKNPNYVFVNYNPSTVGKLPDIALSGG